MKVTGFLTVALLLFIVGISAGRQQQQGNPVHTIDPWAPGIQCVFSLRLRALQRIEQNLLANVLQLVLHCTRSIAAAFIYPHLS